MPLCAYLVMLKQQNIVDSKVFKCRMLNKCGSLLKTRNTHSLFLPYTSHVTFCLSVIFLVQFFKQKKRCHTNSCQIFPHVWAF